MRLNKIIAFISFTFLFCCSDLNQQLAIAGKNKEEIKSALSEVPKNQLEGMEWLVKHMPEQDLKTVTSQFLLKNCNFYIVTVPTPIYPNNKPDLRPLNSACKIIAKNIPTIIWTKNATIF